MALYSVPASSRETVFVQFRAAGSNPTWKNTDVKTIEAGKSTNIFIAGMLPNTTYEMRQRVH